MFGEYLSVCLYLIFVKYSALFRLIYLKMNCRDRPFNFVRDVCDFERFGHQVDHISLSLSPRTTLTLKAQLHVKSRRKIVLTDLTVCQINAIDDTQTKILLRLGGFMALQLILILIKPTIRY